MAFMPIGKFLFPDAALSFRFFIPYLPFGLPAQFVKAVTANFSTITQTAHPRANTNIYLPESYDVDAINITFWETGDYRVHAAAETWRERAIDLNGFVGVEDDYKFEIRVALVDPAYDYVHKVCRYYGAWPTSIGSHSYDVGTSEALMCEVPFVVDGVDYELP